MRVAQVDLFEACLWLYDVVTAFVENALNNIGLDEVGCFLAVFERVLDRVGVGQVRVFSEVGLDLGHTLLEHKSVALERRATGAEKVQKDKTGIGRH